MRSKPSLRDVDQWMVWRPFKDALLEPSIVRWFDGLCVHSKVRQRWNDYGRGRRLLLLPHILSTLFPLCFVFFFLVLVLVLVLLYLLPGFNDVVILPFFLPAFPFANASYLLLPRRLTAAAVTTRSPSTSKSTSSMKPSSAGYGAVQRQRTSVNRSSFPGGSPQTKSARSSS